MVLPRMDRDRIALRRINPPSWIYVNNIERVMSSRCRLFIGNQVFTSGDLSVFFFLRWIERTLAKSLLFELVPRIVLYVYECCNTVIRKVDWMKLAYSNILRIKLKAAERGDLFKRRFYSLLFLIISFEPSKNLVFPPSTPSSVANS